VGRPKRVDRRASLDSAHRRAALFGGPGREKNIATNGTLGGNMTASESPPRRRALASFRVATTLVLGALAIGSASAQTPGSAAAPACERRVPPAHAAAHHAEHVVTDARHTAIGGAYYAALVANEARKLPQASKARITENGSEKKLADTLWDSADSIAFRFDIVNTKRGDTGTEAVIKNADGSKTMHMLRLKVQNGAIT